MPVTYSKSVMLQKRCGHSALAESTIKACYAYFKQGHRDTDEAEHSHSKEDNEIYFLFFV